MPTRHGGADRISTKAKLADELLILGSVLADARERHGFRQAELAEKLGVPASYLSKIENGTRRLDVIELIHIAQAMGADAAELIADVERALTARP
ncbi:MAG TPA: helix-turn-helix transcriptional regulator [Thermoanaerobaculia bacterium]|nr:helix-turn-helix transcriptional regulator [Thermoanaerobaculia bacterium]